MKKVLIVATVIGFLGFEKNDIKILKELGCEVHCATNLIGETERTKGIDMIRHHIDFSRSPFNKNTIVAYKQLEKLLEEEHYDLIHCHTPVGGIIARLAARKYRKKNMLKVIYTAHGFHFYKGAPIKNWVLFYPLEWLFSWITDVLITINMEDYNRAKQNFHAKEIIYLPGVGIDTTLFTRKELDINEKRKEIGLKNDDFIILSVGELSKRKNHQLIIKAMAETANAKLHYVIAGRGNEFDNLTKLAKELGVDKQLHLLGRRSDILELNLMADVFALPSKQEGVSVALMEAIACRVPVICSRIRGNVDLVNDERDMFGVESVDEVTFILKRMIKEKENGRDTNFEKNVSKNYERLEKFSLENVGQQMKSIYENM